jgi:hypothetical protein
MLALQRKRIMVELRPFPFYSLCSMASFTVERKIQLLMIRISGAVIVISVAEHTLRWESYILTATVAVGALDLTVLASQRECSMSKNRTLPSVGICAVTEFTYHWKARVPVIRVACLVIVSLVTEDTVLRQSYILAAAVAIGAISDRVLPGQGKCIVREESSSPAAVIKMAELALVRKSRGNVIGII